MNELTYQRTSKNLYNKCCSLSSHFSCDGITTSTRGDFSSRNDVRTHQLFFNASPGLKWMLLLLAGCFLNPGFLLSQAANLDQTRNGSATSPNNPVQWVNGNAGEQNAHYVEGHSIPYRMYMTSLTPGPHQLVIEWDTKDNNQHAIDYITHYNNLDNPAGSHLDAFGHAPEVVDPTDGIAGLGAPSTFPIPAPSSNGSEVAGMPTASFNALVPASLRLMTIWNGTITSIVYVNEDPQDGTTASTKTRMAINFTTTGSTALLAWAGHIAAEYDWGVGRGAGGLTGSPYHTRLISIDGKGGNQDRSLKAPAIVIPDPDCNISNAQLACPNTPFLEFSSAGSSSGPGITYEWSLTNGNPSAGAKIDPATVNSPTVKVIPSGASFLAGGTFSISLKVTKSTGQTSTCTRNPAGTIQKVMVAATATPTTFDLAFVTTSQLNAVLTGSTDTDPTHYDYSWTQNPPAGGSLSATNIRNPVFTATQAGFYTFEVTATQKAAPNCSNKAQVTVEVTVSAPPCGIGGPSPVCPGSTNAYFYDANGDGSPNVVPPSYSVAWTLENNANGATFTSATNTASVNVQAGTVCNSTFTLRITFTSPTGLVTSCTKTVTVADTDPPVFTSCPANQNLGCNPTTFPAGTPTATDNCGTPAITGGVLGDPVNTQGCTWTRSRTWTATDGCGNTATCTQVFTYTVDQTPPTFTLCPANQNLGCNPTTFPSATPTATDNCGTATITGGVLGNPVNTQGCTWTRSRTWTATDGCGNTATCTQVLTYTVDQTPPTFTLCPANQNLGCNPTTFPSATPTATDNCGIATITGGVLGDPVNTQGCTWTRSRTWTATDGCGNTATCTQVLTYTVDQTPPTFTLCPANQNLGCNPTSFPSATPTATDNCGTATITGGALGDPVNTQGCTWTRSRTWTATDGCGNTATCTQVLTYTVDQTPPTFTLCPANQNLGCNPTTFPSATPTATDNCGTATITGGVLGNPVNTQGCTWTRSRTWTATDGCGNTATCTQVLTYTVDQTPPTFTLCPANQNLGCNPTSFPSATPTATDNCGTATITGGALGDPVNTQGCTWTRSRTWTATDGCGNTATCTQVLTYTVDQTPPTFTLCPANQNLGCNPTTFPSATPTATDNCGTATITGGVLGDPVNTQGCTWTRSRTWTATDGCGNTATCTQVLTYTVDQTPPTFTLCPANQNLGCNPTSFPSATPTATDNCGTATITGGALGDPVNTQGCTWTRSRTWTATDGCGNTATCTQVLTYTVDQTPPTFTLCPANQNLGCNPTSFPSATPTATDNCGTATITGGALGDPVNTQGCTWTRSRTWTATDGCGNTATCTQVLTYTVDQTPPTFTLCPANQNLGCNPTSFPSATPTATDNCGTATITGGALGDPVNTQGCTWTRSRTWTATDGCGNTATCTQVLTYTLDNVAPGFSATPASVDLDCGSDIPAMPTITGTDNCAGVVDIKTDVKDESLDCATGFNRMITRKWTATDACGNTAMHTQIIRIKCCPDLFCTYTQGYFGNTGGMACNGDANAPNKFSTFETIQKSIIKQGGTITIGNPAGKNVKVTSAAADVDKVIEVLPGGGGSYAFTHIGSINIKNLPADYLKKGKINNTLFAQTLTLSINKGISDDFGNLPLQADKFLVTAEPLECGSKIAKNCKYEWNGVAWILTYSPYKSYGKIPVALYNALPTKNINGLLALANSALGGAALPSGVSLGMIADAVDMFNNAFDECKLFISWSETGNGLCTPPVAPPISQSSAKPIQVDESTERLEVKAFPNPAPRDGAFNLAIRSMESGTAIIEYFNANGSKLAQTNKVVQANVTETVRFNGSSYTNGAIIYKVSINGKFARGMVLRLN